MDLRVARASFTLFSEGLLLVCVGVVVLCTTYGLLFVGVVERTGDGRVAALAAAAVPMEDVEPP